MYKILAIFMILPTFIYAAYNPFFSDKKAPKQTAPVKYIIQEVKEKPKPIPPRKGVKMAYLGFIETKKGILALVTFDGQNIIIQKDTILYQNEDVYKIKKITTNYILLRDGNYRRHKIYFTTQGTAPQYNNTNNRRNR